MKKLFLFFIKLIVVPLFFSVATDLSAEEIRGKSQPEQGVEKRCKPSIQGPTGPTGPRSNGRNGTTGPTGPTGPIGPTGPSFESSFLYGYYTGATGQVIAANTAVDFNNILNSPDGAITASGTPPLFNTFNINKSGYYEVTYGVNPSSGTTDQGLTLDGAISAYPGGNLLLEGNGMQSLSTVLLLELGDTIEIVYFNNTSGTLILNGDTPTNFGLSSDMTQAYIVITFLFPS
jgi:hypothetical protein